MIIRLPAISQKNLPDTALAFTALHAEFGARVSGVDLSKSLDNETFARIDDGINQYSILLFENQPMNDEAHLEFTRRFGQLEEEHETYYSQDKVTYIGRVGNIDDDGNKVSSRQTKSSTGNDNVAFG